MDYQKIIASVTEQVKLLEDKGSVATYIPELATVNPSAFGVHLCDLHSQHYSAGNFEEKFSIQSISKMFSLVLAYSFKGEELWKRVDIEPSGNPFNSLLQLEVDNGIPRNPFINAGALVISDILISHLDNPKEDFIAFIRKLANNPTIDYSKTVAESEKKSGFRNTALANYMKALGNIENDIEEVLDFYFYQCSISMSCKELAQTCLFLANSGKIPGSGEKILSESKTKRLNAIMQLCGFYDEAGEFAFRVGLPGKSGVGGGIVAIYPNRYSIVVWSPKLNKKGNSYKGMLFLELFTSETNSSIF